MARTAVTYRNLVANGALNGATGTTTVDATLVTNGVVVASAVPERTIMRVAQTSGAAKNLIVRAGDYPPALASGQGDLTTQVAATTGVQFIGPLESGRFIQNDGTLLVDFESGFTGTIEFLKVPKAV